jgi:hypothetical protein
MQVWAFITPDGAVLADSDFKDEAAAWQAGLGWPDDKEIAIAKGRGYRVLQVEIVVNEEEEA